MGNVLPNVLENWVWFWALIITWNDFSLFNDTVFIFHLCQNKSIDITALIQTDLIAWNYVPSLFLFTYANQHTGSIMNVFNWEALKRTKQTQKTVFVCSFVRLLRCEYCFNIFHISKSWRFFVVVWLYSWDYVSCRCEALTVQGFSCFYF